MAKYHITASGDAGVCKAQIKCPLGDESLHFETAAQARAAYEGIMSAPAAAIKRSLKSLDTDGLRETLFAEAHAAGMDVVAIQKAAALASELHEGQFRSAAPGEKRPPYITHPLRNAARLVRWGAEDTDQVNIAILHDVVEDSPEAFCKSRGIDFSDEQSARDELLSHIETEYGARVASGVKGLSNDIVAPELRTVQTTEEKHDAYAAHVAEAIKDQPDVLIGKISDFHDNGAGLYHSDFPARKAKTRNQAVKYLKTVPALRAELDRNPLPNKKLHDSAIESLELTDARLRWMLSK